MRVVAGQLRGRILRAPRGLATRPTTERVREAWFAMLGDVSGARVLDVYAGTGALGIEALSRGAPSGVFVESAKAAVSVLRSNLANLELTERASVIAAPAERAQAAVMRAGPFDLVLSDPPWTALERSVKTLCSILQPTLFGPGARVVIGHPKRYELSLPETSGLTRIDQRAWGDSGASFFVFEQRA